MEALRFLERAELEHPEHERQTFSTGSSATAIINEWAAQGLLPVFDLKGKPVDVTALTVLEFDGDFGKGLDSMDNSIYVRRAHVLDLLLNNGISIPGALVGEGKFELTAYDCAWYEFNLNAPHWWRLDNVKPVEAAYLLCQHEPSEPLSGAAEVVQNEETGPNDYRIMLRRFEDIASSSPGPRPLEKWLAIAKREDLKFHSWIVNWRQYVDQEAVARDGIIRDKEAKDAAGRHTIEEAAHAIAEATENSVTSIADALTRDVFASKIPAYMPGKTIPKTYQSSREVREWYEELYWDELNTWLTQELPRVTFRFPSPSLQAKPANDSPASLELHSDQDKPWTAHKEGDPEPAQSWYTAARYFARTCVTRDPTFLTRRDALAKEVSRLLVTVGIFKRGGKLPLDPGTVKKSFAKVLLS